MEDNQRENWPSLSCILNTQSRGEINPKSNRLWTNKGHQDLRGSKNFYLQPEEEVKFPVFMDYVSLQACSMLMNRGKNAKNVFYSLSIPHDFPIANLCLNQFYPTLGHR